MSINEQYSTFRSRKSTEQKHIKKAVETRSMAFVATAMLCGRMLRDTLLGVLRAAATWGATHSKVKITL